MKRYPKYKDSGVKWIGEIPEHWEVMRIKSIGQTLGGLTYSPNDICSEEEGVIVLRSSNIKDDKLSLVDNVYVSKEKASAKPIKKGDILICSRNGSAALIGKSALIENDIDASFGAFMMVFRPYTKSYTPKYTHYLLSVCINKYRGLFSTSTINQLTNKILNEISAPITDNLPEQQAIVAYLDEKVGKIDRYISENEKEIVALDELKQATIANAVTRGLDPNAPLKDSGIKWIGNIPQHWEVKRAKNMFVKMQRPVRPEDEVVTCFRDGQVTLRKNRRTEGFTESLKEIGYQGVRKGDLVIHQMDAFAGSIGVSDSDGKGTPVYHCCMPKGDYNNYYYCFVLREMARSGFIKSLYRGIRERSSDFRFDTFAAQWLPIPPRQEQDSIVNFVNERCDKINRMKDGIKSEIEKLKEYKQRLISDVVTGKVCVKGE